MVLALLYRWLMLAAVERAQAGMDLEYGGLVGGAERVGPATGATPGALTSG